MFSEDTITAPATTPGTGAVSIVRISGPDAFAVADRVVRLRRGDISSSEGYRLHFGTVSGRDGALLDEVIVSVFRAPHSYTGEDSVEISCHASAYIVSEMLSLLCDAGARLAEAGEFTMRAYMNGKMDLSQAESVADLIASSDRASHRVAIRQMRGGYSEKLEEIRSQLAQMSALLELELDFSEEDVEFADRTTLLRLVDEAVSHIGSLADSFRDGNAIKNGVPVAIVGNANSGKSMLLNALLGEDRAIVSDIAGTTRDTIEEVFTIDGIRFRLIDTAGLRETDEVIEKIGIERTLRKLAEADVVLAVVDVSAPREEILASLEKVSDNIDFTSQRVFAVVNKCDLVREKSSVDGFPGQVRDNTDKDVDSGHSGGEIFDCISANKNVSAINKFVSSINKEILTYYISAKSGFGLDALKKAIADSQKDRLESTSDAILVTNVRHLNALTQAKASLIDVRSGLLDGTPSDLVAQDLRHAVSSIGSITGEITTDETLGIIFKKFCIGK